MDALFEQRLGALRARVDAFFAAGGKVGKPGEIPKASRAFVKQQGVPNPRKLTQKLKSLALDTSNVRKLPGDVGGKRPASGYKRRNEITFDAVDEIDRLTGGDLRGKIDRMKDKAKSGNRSLGDLTSFAGKIDDRTRRQRNLQRARDAKVGDTAAAQRNAIARRRNLQLTPGTRTQLRSNTAGLFAEQRRGVII